ncbi:SHOCT domain-containing protein [Prescottella agglutinans]|uniref:SHOCT domain-containing protein n=1 Tax=Prescottella agglutinans TaxID=1644129 RepID=UPI003D993F0F
MMFWYGNGMNGWGYALMVFAMIAFWVLIVLAVIAVIRALTRTLPPPQLHADTPEQLLGQRLARGEIDEDEYQRKLDLLQGRHHPGKEGR